MRTLPAFSKLVLVCSAGSALAAALTGCSPSVETGSGAGTVGATATSTGSGGASSSTSTVSSSSSSSTDASTSTTGAGAGGGSTTGTGGSGGQGGGGCTSDADCADPAAAHCDPASGACVACVVDGDCALGSICAQGHTCAPGCSPTQACAPGLTCCGDACFDLDHDLQHCGACAMACPQAPNVVPFCNDGICNEHNCAPSFADCNGLTIDGCEHNVLLDGPCTCAPGETQPCYAGAPGTLDVGPCHAGIQICKVDGTGFGECQGQTLPISEICANGVDDDCDGVADDIPDIDGDGWTSCDGDCNEIGFWPDPIKPAAKNINPGAFEILNNGVDDDCDPTTLDDAPSPSCSPGPLSSLVTALDLAQAMDICQNTVASPPLPQRKWGLIGASFLLADGSVPSAAQLASIQSLQTAALSTFGIIEPRRGPTMAGLSTGKMRDPLGAGFVANAPGSDLGSASSPPAAFLALHGGLLPSNAGCNGACPSGAGAFDSVRLRLTLRVPTNATFFSYEFRFLSAEYGAHSCSPYNDAFLALLTSAAPGLPADKNIAFDALSNPVLVNDVFFESCVAQGCSTCPISPAALTGTGMELGGATQWLPTDAPIVAAETMQLDLMVFDVTDGSGDSHVLLDNFHWGVPCINCWGDH